LLPLMAGAAVSAQSAAGQGTSGQEAASSQQGGSLKVRSELVLVPALVRDKSGALVYTLSANDFVLTDDGVTQKLKLEEDTGGEPLALVVVMEAGAAEAAGWHPKDSDGPNRFAHLPTLVEAVVGGVKGRVAVVVFDGHPRLTADFTPDMDAVASAIADASDEDNMDGGAAILDSLGFAVDMLRKQPPEYRRAILLVSETNDRGSKVPIEDAVRAIGDTNTTIFSVAFASGKAAASNYGHKWLPTKKTEPRQPNPQQVGIPPDIRYPNTSYAKALDAILMNTMFGWFGTNATPNPPGGCFAKNGGDEEDQRQSRSSRTYDCVAQLFPPLAFAKMAAISAVDGMKTNVPKTVAEMTGGSTSASTARRAWRVRW
jgi:hypothetical protein